MSSKVREMRGLLKQAHQAALDAVGGRASVAHYLTHHRQQGLTHVLGVGKAAAPMAAGALDVLGESVRRTLVVTKHGHLDGMQPHAARIQAMTSSHPLPDASCLAAGHAVWQFLAGAPAEAGFLIMVSGGASALMERLPDGLDAEFLARVNDWLLAGGYPIGAVNRVRKRISTIKGGRLASALAGRRALCLMISDVPGDDPKVIGSGPLVHHVAEDMDVSDLELPPWLEAISASPPPLAEDEAFAQVSSAVVAFPRLAREAAAGALRERGIQVRLYDELLEGDALETGRLLVDAARASAGVVHLWGSETTVVLPESPGRGGRCQSLALAAAIELAAGQTPGVVLAAGTDGTDGPGEDAGAVVDEASVSRGAPLSAPACLAQADAGRFLDVSGDLIRTGPTGTNVMDLLMAWSAG